MQFELVRRVPWHCDLHKMFNMGVRIELLLLVLALHHAHQLAPILSMVRNHSGYAIIAKLLNKHHFQAFSSQTRRHFEKASLALT